MTVLMTSGHYSEQKLRALSLRQCWLKFLKDNTIMCNGIQNGIEIQNCIGCFTLATFPPSKVVQRHLRSRILQPNLGNLPKKSDAAVLNVHKNCHKFVNTLE